MSKTRRTASCLCACLVFLGAGVFGQTGANPSWFPPSGLQQLAKLTASDGAALDALGANLAISGDTAVAGVTINFGGGRRNAAYVFVKPASGWADATETAELTPSDGGSIDAFGESVAISGDMVFVGSGHQTLWGTLGAIYVFVRPAGGWISMTETAKLTTKPGIVIGQVIAAGGNSVISSNGQGVLVWNKPAAGWINKGPDATLTGSDGPTSFGNSLAISGTGDTILAYGYLQQARQSLVYLYSRPQTGWRGTLNQTAELISSSSRGVGSFPGNTMAVSGNTVIAEGLTSNLQGAAFVYVKPASGWVNMQETAQLSANNAPDLARSVAVSGNTVFAADPFVNVGGNIGQGAAFVFVKPASGWKTTAHFNTELTAADGAEEGNFGSSLAVSGTTLLVGTPLATIGSNQWQGAAYVFGQ